MKRVLIFLAAWLIASVALAQVQLPIGPSTASWPLTAPPIGPLVAASAPTNSYVQNGVHMGKGVQISTANNTGLASDSCHVIMSFWTRTEYVNLNASYSYNSTSFNADVITNMGGSSSEATNGINITNDANGFRINIGGGGLFAGGIGTVPAASIGVPALYLISANTCTTNVQNIQASIVYPDGLGGRVVSNIINASTSVAGLNTMAFSNVGGASTPGFSIGNRLGSYTFPNADYGDSGLRNPSS